MSKFCDKCGAELKNNDKFCQKCGNPVNTYNENSSSGVSYSCPYCGETISYSAKCPYCGKSLQNNDGEKAVLVIVLIIILIFIISFFGLFLLIFA